MVCRNKTPLCRFRPKRVLFSHLRHITVFRRNSEVTSSISDPLESLIYGAVMYTFVDIINTSAKTKTWQEKLVDFGGFAISGAFIFKFLKMNIAYMYDLSIFYQN